MLTFQQQLSQLLVDPRATAHLPKGGQDSMIISPHSKDNLIAISEKALGGGDFAKLKAFPGHFKWHERNCIFRATGENIKHILKHWPDARWLGSANDVLKEFQQHQKVAEETSHEKIEPSKIIQDKGYSYARKPMEHQRRAFALSRDRKTFGLFMEQGTGKTKVILDTAQWLFQKGEINCLVVVAWPNGVHRNWIDYEIPADVRKPYYADYWSSNWKTTHRQKALNKFLTSNANLSHAQNCLKIFCMSVEALTSKGAQDYLLKLLNSHKCLFVIDQSASIKNPQAKRTKFLINKCSELAPYRRVMDGQPVAEGASELFSQFKFLDPWIIGHDTWTAFKAEFCKIGFFNEIIGYQNMDELRRRIDGFSFRVREEECLDLPARIYKMWSFNLSSEERRIYDELKVKSLAYFRMDSGGMLDEHLPLEEHNALVKNMRLQQISSGWWPEDKLIPIDKGQLPSRAQALLELLKSIEGEKALIFARFRSDLALSEKLLPNSVSYHGGVSDEDRRDAKKLFMTNHKIKYFLGQPRSAGLGHTLTAARHVIFYSNDHSLRLREECEKRAHRQGLKHRLMIWDLIGKDTQDIKIVRAFRAKKELANEILADPDNFFLDYK